MDDEEFEEFVEEIEILIEDVPTYVPPGSDIDTTSLTDLIPGDLVGDILVDTLLDWFLKEEDDDYQLVDYVPTEREEGSYLHTFEKVLGGYQPVLQRVAIVEQGDVVTYGLQVVPGVAGVDWVFVFGYLFLYGVVKGVFNYHRRVS